MAMREMGRLLLQQSPGGCPQQLGGVSVGGWIALSLFIGIFIGSASTMLIQCWRRRRELRYMDKGASVRQSMVMMQALPAAPRTPVSFMQPPALPPPNGARASTSGSVQAGAGANKYYSPLNTNKGHGSVAMVHQLTELRSSMHLSDNGGDTQSVAASDQQAPRDKNGAVANQAAAAAGAGQVQRSRDFSQHGMRQQQGSSHGGAAWSSAAPAVQAGGPMQARPPSSLQVPPHQSSTAYAAGTQLPQEVSSSILSADGPLQPEDSSPMSASKAATEPSRLPQSTHAATQHTAAGHGGSPTGMPAAAAVAPSPRQHAQLPSSPDKPAAATGGEQRRQAASPSGAEIEDEYEDHELDDDWRALLGGVDARLNMQGARPMNARERAVAIKKLLVATGTRGVEFALNTTLQEVLNFRQLHGH